MIDEDDVRAYFKQQYGEGGRDADMAKAVLDLFDRLQTADEESERILIEIGDLDEAALNIRDYEKLVAWAERSELVDNEPGETLEERLESIIDRYELYEQQSFALQDLCVEAGLLARNDFETNPIPLIRMFLPID